MKLAPVAIIINEINGIIASGIVSKWNGAFVTIINAINNKKEIPTLIISEIMLPKINMYFGAAVFCKIFEFPLIEDILPPTVLVNPLNIVLPANK